MGEDGRWLRVEKGLPPHFDTLPLPVVMTDYCQEKFAEMKEVELEEVEWREQQSS